MARHGFQSVIGVNMTKNCDVDFKTKGPAKCHCEHCGKSYRLWAFQDEELNRLFPEPPFVDACVKCFRTNAARNGLDSASMKITRRPWLIMLKMWAKTKSYPGDH